MANFIQDRKTGLLLPKKQRGFIAIGPGIITPYRDPQYSSVSSLLPFDGNITDKKGIIWTANGGAATSATNPKWGTASLLLNGSGQYLTAATGAAWNFTNTFTIECWLLPLALSSNAETLFTTRGTSVNAGISLVYTNAGVGATCWDGGSNVTANIPVSGTLSTSNYNHVALVGFGGNLKIYINGTQAGTSAQSGGIADGLTVNIGRDPSAVGPRYANARIDDFRVTKTVGRYTASFTPPTAPFPNSGP